MGAWGEGAFENDEGLEWIGAEVERVIVKAIKKKLVFFLSHPKNEVIKYHVEAAIALLVCIITNPKGISSCFLSIGDQATAEGLWDLGFQAIDRLKKDKKWLEGWNFPEKKINTLERMKMDLELARKQTESIE